MRHRYVVPSFSERGPCEFTMPFFFIPIPACRTIGKVYKIVQVSMDVHLPIHITVNKRAPSRILTVGRWTCPVHGLIFVRDPCFHRFIVPIPHLASAKSYVRAKSAGESVFLGVLGVLSLSLDPLSFRFPF